MAQCERHASSSRVRAVRGSLLGVPDGIGSDHDAAGRLVRPQRNALRRLKEWTYRWRRADQLVTVTTGRPAGTTAMSAGPPDRQDPRRAGRLKDRIVPVSLGRLGAGGTVPRPPRRRRPPGRRLHPIARWAQRRATQRVVAGASRAVGAIITDQVGTPYHDRRRAPPGRAAHCGVSWAHPVMPLSSGRYRRWSGFPQPQPVLRPGHRRSTSPRTLVWSGITPAPTLGILEVDPLGLSSNNRTGRASRAWVKALPDGR